jgi:hypothetical protein
VLWALLVQLERRIEDKIWRRRAAPFRSVYKKSQSSSTPCFTKGAAVNPTKIPAIDRKKMESISTRAMTNSLAANKNPIRNHATFGLNRSHSEAVKAK